MAIFLAVFSFPELIFASEQIPTFNSDIIINKDTSIRITETIQFVTTQSKHGIYRYIPIRYTRQGLSYTARVKDIVITDDLGKQIPFSQSFDNGNVMLKIGDPDRTFTGKKIYRLSYTVENAVNQVKDEKSQLEIPELYWDITGEGWQVDIASSSAAVHSPHAAIGSIVCYSGAFGQNDQRCSSKKISEDQAIFNYPVTIRYGDNMTVAVGLNPQNNLQFPTPLQKFIKSLLDNISMLPLLGPGVIMGLWWWLKGRDKTFFSWNVFNQDATQPQQVAPLFQRRPIPMVYAPIKELTPGEAGVLLDEKVDTQDVIAEIIDLARQKFLKIERQEKKKLFFSSTDYTFTQLKPPNDTLPKHQTYLLEKLFSDGPTVKLSELKGSFYTHTEKTKNMILTSLVKKGYFATNPATARGLGFSVAIISLVMVGWWGINLLTQGLLVAIPVYIFSALLSLLCAYHLPAKTAMGSNFAWQVKGLQRSIRYGAWREKIKEKHLFFEEVLPFAIALGVVDSLSKDMAQLNVKDPRYLPISDAQTFTTSRFIHAFSTQASTNLTYNPSSSSWSSSSGSSGGGSSGGGGGGGGGGSW